jgi:pyroglutamyl-peptidase
MLETILLTGFGPFGDHERNVSGEAARRLDGAEIGGFRVRSLTLPVQFEKAVAALEEAVEGETPAAIISSGICRESDPARFRLEVAARNERHYPCPDVDGNTVRDALVEEGAPPMVFSTLPAAAIRQAWTDAGLSAELSDDAGRYLCNAIFYWAARRVTPAGFIHVPPQEDADQVLRALELALEATAARLLADRVEATA